MRVSLLLLGLALLLGAIVLALRDGGVGGREDGDANVVPTKVSREKPAQNGLAGEGIRRGGVTIMNLRGEGWLIDAERMGEQFAEGEVRLTSPSGALYSGDDLRIEEETGEIPLTGLVSATQDGASLSSVGADEFIRLAVDESSVVFSPGRWETKAR